MSRLEWSRRLDLEVIKKAVQRVGFGCTDCGDCCRSDGEEFAVMLLADERKELEKRETPDGDLFNEPVEPLPWGENETFGWTVGRDGCGDCVFHDGEGCSVYRDRPVICRTFPFNIYPPEDLPEGYCPYSDVSDQVKSSTTQEPNTPFYIELASCDAVLTVDACEGVGGDTADGDAMEFARNLKRRKIREATEETEVLQVYRENSVELGKDEVAVYDSTGVEVVKD
ncbi:MAG: YkgJ family cysteine cluster protein [Halobacteria archaeon]